MLKQVVKIPLYHRPAGQNVVKVIPGHKELRVLYTRSYMSLFIGFYLFFHYDVSRNAGKIEGAQRKYSKFLVEELFFVYF